MKSKLIAVFLAALVVALAPLAFAADAGIDAAGAVVATPAAAGELDIADAIGDVVDAARAGNWMALTGTLLILIVWAARKFMPNLSILSTPRRRACAVVLLGALGGVATALLSGRSIDVRLILGGIITACVASGGRELFANIISPKPVAPSQ